MALSDLELLTLADRASEAKRGERGPQGVSIREIRSVSPTEIVIVLTDGRSFPHRFPEPTNGVDGQPGKPGADSTVPGPRGPKGEMGEAGRDGRDGVGLPGVSVDSALVNTSGELLIGLTDGSVISAGRVVGPAGQSGERGMTGIQGPAGRDGAAFLSGERPPSDAEDGQDGDFYVDISSPQKDVYGPKRGGAWGGRSWFMQAPQPPTNQPVRSGSGGAGGGGGGNSGFLPPFAVSLPATFEQEIARVTDDAAVIEYKVTSTADATFWSAGSFNTAATALVDDAEFTIASELFGTGGDLDLAWRVSRVGNQLVIYATSPVDAQIKGRIRKVTEQ